MNALHAAYLAAEVAERSASAALARATEEEEHWLRRVRTEFHNSEEILHGCWNAAQAVAEAEADLAEARTKLAALIQFMDAV